MDGFSVLSLTSFCTNISHAAISASVDLSSLTHTLPPSPHAERLSARLLSFSSTLEQYGHTAAQLEHRLERRGVVISPALRSKLATWLDTCQGSMARLNKQLSRLDPGTAVGLDWDYLVLQRDLLVAYMQLFLYFEELLGIEEAGTQDSMLDGPDARCVLEQVEDTLRCTSKVPPDILPENSNQVNHGETTSTIHPTSMDADEPPPAYEAAVPAPHVSASPPTQSQDAKQPPPFTATARVATPATAAPTVNPFDFTSLDLSSLKHGLRAMTSRLSWFRPDPLAGALCEASRRGDVQQVAGLVQQGAHVDGRDESGRSPLGCAIAEDQTAAARLLLSMGADVHSNSCSGGGSGSSRWPPLFVAAQAGSLGVAALLIERGARPTDASITGQPYFYDLVHSCAGDKSGAHSGSIEGIRFLLERGAKPDASSLSGRPAIIAAARKGRIDIVRLLLDYGASAKSSDYTGNSVLTVALDQPNGLEMAELLLQRGGDPNSTSTTGDPVLSGAVSKRNIPFARLLLAAGARADKGDYTGQPIIVNAVRDTKLSDADKTELVRLLLEHGASAKAKDLTWTSTVLHHAIDKASAEVVSLLIKHGADISGHRKGEPLLFSALQSERPGMVEALLRGGASADVVDSKGNSLMMAALLKQDLELVKLLRQYQASVDVGPREFARAMGRADFLEALGMTDGEGTDEKK